MEDNIRLTQGYMEDLKRIDDLAESARRVDDGINYNLTLLKSLSRIQQMMGGLTGPEMDVISKTEEEAPVARRSAPCKTDYFEARELNAMSIEFNPYWDASFVRAVNEVSLAHRCKASLVFTHPGFLTFSPIHPIRSFERLVSECLTKEFRMR